METGSVSSKGGLLLWGIYHASHREAQIFNDRLRTIVQATTRIEAEEVATTLGFGDAWAHPVSWEEARHVQWVPIRMQRLILANVSETGIQTEADAVRKRRIHS